MLRIGFVYDLRTDYLQLGMTEEETAEFDSQETIDAIEQALALLGHTVIKIGHLRNLIARLANHETYDLIFNIAEGVKGYSREAEVPVLLEAYGIPYTFSSPDVLIKCHDKSWAKQIVHHAGLATPPFALINSLKDIDSIQLNFPLFIKPVAEGTGKGISVYSLINNAQELLLHSQQLLAQFSQKAAELALRCWQALGCRDAGRIDIRCDAQDVPYFLEVNPLAGLNPSRSDLCLLTQQLGMNHAELIAQILQRSLQRYPYLMEKNRAHSYSL